MIVARSMTESLHGALYLIISLLTTNWRSSYKCDTYFAFVEQNHDCNIMTSLYLNYKSKRNIVTSLIMRIDIYFGYFKLLFLVTDHDVNNEYYLLHLIYLFYLIIVKWYNCTSKTQFENNCRVISAAIIVLLIQTIVLNLSKIVLFLCFIIITRIMTSNMIKIILFVR